MADQIDLARRRASRLEKSQIEFFRQTSTGREIGARALITLDPETW